MIATLIDTTDLQKQIVIHWEEMMNGYKTTIKKAQKEKEAAKSQFAMLKSENITFSNSLEKAKVAWDKAIAMATLLKSEHESLIRVAKAKA